MASKTYTRRAKRAISNAKNQVSQKYTDILGVENLLLELFFGSYNTTNFLKKFLYLDKTTTFLNQSGLPQITPFEKRKAETWAEKLGHNKVDTEHLLLAILEQSEETMETIKTRTDENQYLMPKVFETLSKAKITTEKFLEEIGSSRRVES